MRKHLCVLLALTLLVAVQTALPVDAVAIDVAIEIESEPPLEFDVSDLVSAHHSLDGREVIFVGEAIGEALGAHSDWKWVNILGTTDAIGVVVPAEWVARIDRFGDYQEFGSRVRIEGILNIACVDHGGDLDVHATALEVIEPGSDRPDEASPVRFALAGSLVALGLGLFVLYGRFMRRTL